MTRLRASFILPAVALLAVTPAVAADAGTVIFAKGSVSAEREPPVALAKGDGVLGDDTIVTGAAARAQLEMIDGAKIAIRPDSRLEIQEYEYTDPSAGASVVTTDEKAVMRLVKGGFRTITGAIGKQDESDYEVRTAVGVLGIRGTDYAAVFCRGDCTWAPGVSAAAPIEDGLYVGVIDGTVVFSNALATIEIDSGEYVFIPLESQQPETLSAPPPVLIDENDLAIDAAAAAAPSREPAGQGDASRPRFDAAIGTRRAPAGFDASGAEQGSGRPEEEQAETPAQPVLGTDPDGTPVDITPGQQPDPQGPRTISYSSGRLGNLDTPLTAVGDNEPGQYRLDDEFNLVGFSVPIPGRTGPDIGDFDIGTASNVDTGFDSATVLRWGRWAGGTATVTTQSDGSVEQIDLGSQSIHWIQGPEGAPPVMPITGSASYTLVGATSPTDDQGNVGVLGNATFFADFTNMRVDSTLEIDIAGSSWIAGGSGTIGAQALLPAHMFQGFYNVTVDGVTGGSGQFSGFFSEPGNTSNPDFPGGVGLTYSLSDPQGFTIVSGAAAFGNP